MSSRGGYRPSDNSHRRRGGGGDGDYPPFRGSGGRGGGGSRDDDRGPPRGRGGGRDFYDSGRNSYRGGGGGGGGGDREFRGGGRDYYGDGDRGEHRSGGGGGGRRGGGDRGNYEGGGRGHGRGGRDFYPDDRSPHSRGGGGGGRGGGGFEPPLPPSQNATHLLQLMDLGLDFRSYAHITDRDGTPLLQNVLALLPHDVKNNCEPTVGLLVTLLHLMHHTHPTEKEDWLAAYEEQQAKFLSGSSAAGDTHVAEESVRYIRTVKVLDDHVYRTLMGMLDRQCSLRGSNTPSQRRVPRDPKASLCNLFLTKQGCHQGFLCNQVHLNEDASLAFRTGFYVKLVSMLRSRGTSEAEIATRVKDAVFFALYGNKVTVRVGRGSIQYFKTLYTVGRLKHALEHSEESCMGPHCHLDGNCPGIHLQDERNVQLTRQMELPNPQAVAQQLEEEALRVLRADTTTPPPPHVARERQRPDSLFQRKPIEGGLPKPGGDGNTPATATSDLSNKSKGNFSDSVDSPTTKEWKKAVESFGDAPAADPNLVSHFKPSAAVAGSPANTSDGMTPLLADMTRQRFESLNSSTEKR